MGFSVHLNVQLKFYNLPLIFNYPFLHIEPLYTFPAISSYNKTSVFKEE